MQIFKLTIVRVPDDPQVDFIYRTHTIKALNLSDAESRHTVQRLVSTMDNVAGWYARAV